MLKPENRLRKKRDFENVFKNGKGFKESFLLFKFAKNNLIESRFGFVVGKKVSKKAVERNQVQRRLKSAVKMVFDDIVGGIDGVFVAFPGIEQQKSKDIQQVLKKILEKSRAIKV